jgi:hypothetical protein
LNGFEVYYQVFYHKYDETLKTILDFPGISTLKIWGNGIETPPGNLSFVKAGSLDMKKQCFNGQQ